MAEPGRKQFIVLPLQGIRVPLMSAAAASGRFLSKLAVRPGPVRPISFSAAPGVELRLLDSVDEYGAKLVEIAPASLSALRAHQPSLRLVPLAYYHPAVTPRLRIESQAYRRQDGREDPPARGLAQGRVAGGRRAGGGLHRFPGEGRSPGADQRQGGGAAWRSAPPR